MLDANKIQYQECDVSADKAARDEMVKMTGRMAVPVTTIDGEAIVGYDEKAIKEKLGI